MANGFSPKKIYGKQKIFSGDTRPDSGKRFQPGKNFLRPLDGSPARVTLCRRNEVGVPTGGGIGDEAPRRGTPRPADGGFAGTSCPGLLLRRRAPVPARRRRGMFPLKKPPRNKFLRGSLDADGLRYALIPYGLLAGRYPYSKKFSLTRGGYGCKIYAIEQRKKATPFPGWQAVERLGISVHTGNYVVALGGLYPFPGGLSRARRDLLTSPGNSVVARSFRGFFYVHRARRRSCFFRRPRSPSLHYGG